MIGYSIDMMPICKGKILLQSNIHNSTSQSLDINTALKFLNFVILHIHQLSTDPLLLFISFSLYKLHR